MDITLAQAIRNAIESERAGRRFYAHLARCSVEERARDLLLEMAEQEEEHAKALEELGRVVVGGALPEGPSPYAEHVEVPINAALLRRATLEEALAVAHEGELSAALYYEALADSCGGMVSEFFRGLSDGEKRHVEQVQELMRIHLA